MKKKSIIPDKAKQSQEVMELVTNLLQSSIEYSVIGRDLEGKILFWNEGARRFYGYEPQELVDKTDLSILYAEEEIKSGKPQQIMESALRHGKWEGIINQRRKQGELFPARMGIIPRCDDAGNPIGFLLISKDMSRELNFTQVRRAKMFDSAILSNSQEAIDFITNILESSTEYSVIGKDLDGKILLWNEGARRLYGYEPEEVIGKANSSILYTEEDVKAGKPKEILDAVLRNGKWEGTVNRRRKNGTLFTARVVITPRRDLLGHAIGFLLISKDITDEIRLTEQLKATQFYTRSLIESNIDALMTTDPLGVISDVNKQMETLTGYTREELIGSPFKNYFTDPQRAEKGIKLVLREGKVANYELTALSKTGFKTVVSYNASTFRNAEGKLQGVFAAARDITEQKKLEQKLRDSQAYNRGLIEASVDGLITVDPQGLISDVNVQMCRMSGYSSKKLIGSPFVDYFLDGDRADTGVKQTFKEGIVKDYVLTMATRDKRQLAVSFNASVFTAPSGAISGIFASARDVTEQKKLEQQLRDQHFYTRSLIESNIDALMTTNQLGVISDVNQQMELLTGCSREELIGSPFKNYFTDPKRAEEDIKLVLRKGKITDYELTARAKDGKETVVSYNATTFADRDGKLQGVFAAARDITERKRFEQTLLERNGEKDVLIRELYHRTKNNMQVISSLLSLHALEIKDEKLLKPFQEMQTRIQAMALVHEKLYRSKDLHNIDMGDYIADLVKSLCNSLCSHPGTCGFNFDTERILFPLELAIPCGIIITEMMSNTIKHAFPNGQGGQIFISLHALQEDKIELIFSDNGVGLPDNFDIKHVKSLGLQIVYNLVKKQLDGEIELLRNHKGTEFRLRFPNSSKGMEKL